MKTCVNIHLTIDVQDFQLCIYANNSILFNNITKECFIKFFC